MEPAEPSQIVATIEPRQLWDKQQNESQKAFDAFAMYRDLEKRSFKAIAEKLNCSPQNIFQWSSRFNWKGRCDAFDVEQDRQQRAEFARNRVRMRERHRALAVAMGGIAAHAVREWQQKIAKGAALDLSVEQVAMLAKVSAELESRVLGIDDEHHATTINVLLGSMRYEDEPEEKGEVVWETIEDVERKQWEGMTDAERESMRHWKNPPKGLD